MWPTHNTKKSSSKWASATRPLQTTSPTLSPLRVLSPDLLQPPPNSLTTNIALLTHSWGPLTMRVCQQKKCPLLFVSFISLVTPRQLSIDTLSTAWIRTTRTAYLNSCFGYLNDIYSCLSIRKRCNMRTMLTCITHTKIMRRIGCNYRRNLWSFVFRDDEDRE